MQEPLLEDLFAAFRDRGDATALAAVFDRTAGELLTLALHLAPETSAAEDLVQATFLAAIQGASTFERGRRLMPWLVGILANQAARARRDRARIVDPARVEVRSEPDPALASEQREILATLTRAISELPDTCRESVRRHLLEGERAVDIARAEGLAPGTVRMQILRGLERLKRVVPASLLSAAPIVIETGRMTQVRTAVISAARSHVPVASASAASTPLWSTIPVIGGAFVTLKLCIAAIVLTLIGLIAWRTSDRSTTAALSAPTRTSLARTDIDASQPPASPERAVAPTNAGRVESSSPSAAPTSANGWWLTGMVRGLDGLDATQTTIKVSCIPGAGGELSCRPTSDGRFVLDVAKYFVDDPKPAYLLVYASHPANRDASANVLVAPDQVSAGSTRRVEWNVDLELVPFAVLVGRVDVPNGDVPTWTSVVVFRNDGKSTDPAWNKLASSERHGDGTFQLRVDGDGDALIVAQAEGFVPACAPVHFERGIRSDVGTLQLVRGAISVEGRVEPGFAAAGTNVGMTAEVHARRPGPKPKVGEGWHGARFGVDALGIARVALDEQRAPVDADGAFRLHGLPPGEWELDLDIANVIQLGPRSTKCVIPSPPIVLGRELDRWSLRVMSNGKPVPDAVLVATLGDQKPRQATDAEGKAQVVAPFSTGWDLEVSAPGFVDKHVTIPPATQAFDSALEVELARSDDPRATLILRIAGGSTAPEAAQVSLQCIDAKADSIGKTFRTAGPYEIVEVPPGKWSVLVQPSTKAWFGMPGGSDLQDLRFEVVLAPHEQHVETITFEKGGRVDFEVDGWNEVRAGSGPWAHMHIRDTAHRTIASSLVVRESHAGSLSLVAYDDQIALYAPSTLQASLPEGTYTIELDDPDWTANAVSFQVKAGETTKVRVTVARR